MMMVGAAEYADRVLPMDCLALLCALCNTDDESCLFFSTGALCLFRYTRSLGSLFCKFAPPHLMLDAWWWLQCPRDQCASFLGIGHSATADAVAGEPGAVGPAACDGHPGQPCHQPYGRLIFPPPLRRVLVVCVSIAPVAVVRVWSPRHLTHTPAVVGGVVALHHSQLMSTTVLDDTIQFLLLDDHSDAPLSHAIVCMVANMAGTRTLPQHAARGSRWVVA